MENNFSALKSIQELKNLLDSGAITQAEYEELKRKIIFGSESTTGAIAASQVTPTLPVTPPDVPKPSVPPPAIGIPGTGHSVTGAPITPSYQQVNNSNTGQVPLVTADRLKPIRNPETSPINQPKEQSKDKPKDWLLTILITLAVILLIGLVGYYFLNDAVSERLTSKSGPDTEEPVAEVANNSEAPIVTQAAPVVIDTIRKNQPKTATEPVNAPTETTVTETVLPPAVETPVTSPDVTPASTVAASALTDEEVVNKIKERLQAYYADIKNPPFNAQIHFAPNVERYYTLSSTTPQAINDNISSYHYNEFQESQSSIEDGSLKLTNSSDNSYEVTYIEHGSAFRKSRGQKQETTARVRARLNQNFKLTYFRQEQLLENKFTDQ